MRLYEFESKKIFKLSGIPVPDGIVIGRNDYTDGQKMLEKYNEVVLKAQVLVGGRGKAGGIKFVSNIDEYNSAIKDIFSMRITGYEVKYMLVEEKIKIDNELYLSIFPKHSSAVIDLIFSTVGGMDIEKCAKRFPNSIFIFEIDINRGINLDELEQFFKSANVPMNIYEKIIRISNSMYEIFLRYDA